MNDNQINFNQALYNCATECALLRQGGRCEHTFGDAACQQCDYYVSHYVNADPRHVKLFMMEAENRAESLRHRSSIPRTLLIIGIVLAITFFVLTQLGKTHQADFQLRHPRPVYIQ